MGTPDFAQIDLALDALETRRSANQVTDRIFFRGRIDVVEFEYHRVLFSAIYTRVRAQVCRNVGAVASMQLTLDLQPTRIIIGLVCYVVISRIQRLARFAIRVAAAVFTLIEILDRHFAFAFWTTLRFNIHSKAMI
jgi:hypothetical protein